MVQTIRLGQSVEQIRTAILAKLTEAATAPAEDSGDEPTPLGALIGPGQIINGDQTESGKAQGLALWVWLGTARANPSPRQRAALRETWTLPVVVVSSLPVGAKSKAAEHQALATDVAAEASSVLIADRRLGLASFVIDVRRTELQAAYASDAVWSAAAELEVDFGIYDRPQED